MKATRLLCGLLRSSSSWETFPRVFATNYYGVRSTRWGIGPFPARTEYFGHLLAAIIRPQFATLH